MNDTVKIKNNPFSSEEDWGYVVEENTPESTNKAPSKRFHLYLMAPAIILLASITIYPFFWLIYMSLHKVKLGPAKDKFVGLKNYAKLLSDDQYLDGWIILGKYSFLCLSFEIILGVIIALILNNSRFEKILITLFLMPMMVSPIVAGLLWSYLYNGTFGWYHWLFESVGLVGGASILGLSLIHI